MLFGQHLVLRDQVVVENVEHEVFISEEFDFDLFLFGGGLDEGGGFFVNGNRGDFALAFSAADDEKLLDIAGDCNEVLDFVFRECDRTGGILFGVEVDKNGTGRGLSIHGIFVVFFFIILNHVKSLFFPVVFELIFSILLKSHALVLLFNPIPAGLHDLEDSFVNFEIFPFGVGFVLLELFLHWLLRVD